MKAIRFLIIALFFLGACETIEVEKIVTDTVYLEKPVTKFTTHTVHEIDTVVITDTLKVEILIIDTVINNITTVDTVIHVVTKDSIIYKEVEKLVYVYDTLTQVVNNFDTVFVYVTDTVEIQTIAYDRTVTYLDTMVAVSYMRPTFSVPDDIIPHLEEFNRLAHEYGRQPEGGVMIVQYVDELPGEGWTSNSFQVSENSQIVIQLDQRYPAALHRAGMLRELARIMLREKYTTTPDRIMNPQFSPEATITQKHLDDLFK